MYTITKLQVYHFTEGIKGKEGTETTALSTPNVPVHVITAGMLAPGMQGVITLPEGAKASWVK